MSVHDFAQQKRHATDPVHGSFLRRTRLTHTANTRYATLVQTCKDGPQGREWNHKCRLSTNTPKSSRTLGITAGVFTLCRVDGSIMYPVVMPLKSRYETAENTGSAQMIPHSSLRRSTTSQPARRSSNKYGSPCSQELSMGYAPQAHHHKYDCAA